MVQNRGCLTSNLSAFGGNLMVICFRKAGFIFTLGYKMVQREGSYTRNLSAFGGNLMANAMSFFKFNFVFNNNSWIHFYASLQNGPEKGKLY
jgi:hypothetical protein